MDIWLFERVNGLAGNMGWFDAFMRFLSTFGVVIAIAAVVLLLFFSRKRSWGVLGVLSLLVSLAVNRVLKTSFDRPRPFMDHEVMMLLERGASPSFPSDQAVIVGVCTIVLFFASRQAGLAALVFSALVIFSRVVVGHHYPSDVMVGFLLGVVCAFIIGTIWAQLRKNTVGKAGQTRHFP